MRVSRSLSVYIYNTLVLVVVFVVVVAMVTVGVAMCGGSGGEPLQVYMWKFLIDPGFRV